MVNNTVVNDPAELKVIIDNLLRDHYPVFSRLLPETAVGQVEVKIERVYSKGEIRHFVCECLIPEYQHEVIVNAVTDYFYGLHVGA